MSQSSRFPAVAGTIAGLLAAALGAWYLYPGHIGPQQTKAPATRAAPRATIAQATERLMAVPELKELAAYIERKSGGKSHGGVMEDASEPKVVNGKPYYELTFVENGPEQMHRVDTFLVSAVDNEILVQDVANDTLLTLGQWRQRRAAPTSRVE